MSNINQFYTYLYCDPKDGTPRYIGKGYKRRAWTHIKKSSNQRLQNMIQKRVREGYVVEPIINFELDETTAFNMEVFWIDIYGRKDLGTGTLFNQTSGGEGSSGSIRSEEARAKISAAAKNRSEETRAKIGAAHKNKVVSDETRAKMSAASKGRTFTEETRAKLSAANKNKIVSEETRAKIGAVHKNKVVSEETRAKIAAAAKNISAETRAKRSAAAKGRSKPVHTPLGDFDSRCAASIAHNVSPYFIIHRIRKDPTNYYYISKR